MPINVVLDSGHEIAAIWIFDPNDRDPVVVSASISQNEQVDAIIGQIRERLIRASKTA